MSETPVSVNNRRFDPFPNSKFRVSWDGLNIAGITKVSVLKRTTEVIEHRAGADPGSPQHSPGQTRYASITLERGITGDKKFEEWAKEVWDVGSKSRSNDFRKNVTIELIDASGDVVSTYTAINCWVSEFTAFPVLDSADDEIAIQSITLQHDGWLI